MKNFLLADSSELMAVRLISASPSSKTFDSYFLTWFTLCSWKIFFWPIRASWWLLDSFRPPEPKNVWFLLSRHNVPSSWWKIFFSPDASELMVVRTHFGLLSQKNVWFPTFLTWYTSSWRKIFFSPIRANFWQLDSIRPPEPKNVDSYFLHKSVRRVHEKFSSRRFERADGS